MNYNDIFKHWQNIFTHRGYNESIAELNKLSNDETLLEDCFYKDLSFGTAGLRGILGLGTNRMNIYTVGRATQGFAQYLNKTYDNPSIAIAYDSRNMSKEFSELASSIMAANNIKVYLFNKLTPTPTLSYAIRKLGCSGGINITASHNPAEYNGYKAYDNTGCQINNTVADAISAEISSVDIFNDVKNTEFCTAIKNGLISYLDDSFIDEFIDEVFSLRLTNEPLSDLNITYTPLNGAGRYSIMSILEKLGVGEIHTVEAQLMPDGNFPTCPYPNPESEPALKLGIELMLKAGSDVLIATDPDCDRVGIAIPSKDGSHRIISGNELGVLLLDYICSIRTSKGTLPKNPVAIRSIVSTTLFDKIGESYSVAIHKVLTGFKHIGDYLNHLEADNKDNSFIFAFEESCGYLSGTHARDKDAVVGTLMIAELVAYHKKNNRTLEDALNNIYQKYGYFVDRVYSFEFPGKQGMDSMQSLMANLRTNPPQQFADTNITAWLDYLISERKLKTGDTTKIDIPKSDILAYELGELGSVIIRPSGTEPKLKVYFSIREKTSELAKNTYNKLLESIKSLVSKY